MALLWGFGLFRYGSEELSIPVTRVMGKLGSVSLGILSLDLEVISTIIPFASRPDELLQIAVIALCHGHFESATAYVVGKIVATCLLVRDRECSDMYLC